MANTRNLNKDDRKAKKREQRRAFKAHYAALSAKERDEWRRSEKSLKGYLKEKGRI